MDLTKKKQAIFVVHRDMDKMVKMAISGQPINQEMIGQLKEFYQKNNCNNGNYSSDIVDITIKYISNLKNKEAGMFHVIDLLDRDMMNLININSEITKEFNVYEMSHQEATQTFINHKQQISDLINFMKQIYKNYDYSSYSLEMLDCLGIYLRLKAQISKIENVAFGIKPPMVDILTDKEWETYLATMSNTYDACSKRSPIMFLCTCKAIIQMSLVEQVKKGITVANPEETPFPNTKKLLEEYGLETA